MSPCPTTRPEAAACCSTANWLTAGGGGTGAGGGAFLRPRPGMVGGWLVRFVGVWFVNRRRSLQSQTFR